MLEPLQLHPALCRVRFELAHAHLARRELAAQFVSQRLGPGERRLRGRQLDRRTRVCTRPVALVDETRVTHLARWGRVFARRQHFGGGDLHDREAVERKRLVCRDGDETLGRVYVVGHQARVERHAPVFAVFALGPVAPVERRERVPHERAAADHANDAEIARERVARSAPAPPGRVPW